MELVRCKITLYVKTDVQIEICHERNASVEFLKPMVLKSQL
jgi:hypothetical protein